MADGDLYETDILEWSERQADVLRTLAACPDLPDGLDLVRVAEEIEGVGQSEFNTVKILIRRILLHAIKCAADPDTPAVGHWQEEIRNWQWDLCDRLTPSMKRKLDLEAIWKRALHQAERSSGEHNRKTAQDRVRGVFAGIPCPVSLDELYADIEVSIGVVDRLTAVVATQTPEA
jgi:hypothetical protein